MPLALQPSGGNVGIGTSSPSTKLEVEDGFISTYHNINANGAGYGLQFYTNGGGSKNTIASIDISQVGTARSGTLIFNTSNAGAPTERMRITSGGNVLANKTVTGQVLTNGFEFNPTDNYLSICNSTSANYSLYVANTGTSGTRNMVAFYGTSSIVGSITYNGTTTLYNATSDYRLKEDLKDYNGLEIVSKLKTYDFKWKEAGVRDYGMMAHELQEVLPNYVSGEKDALNEDGTIKTQGVDYSKLVPILVKSIQELEARLKTIENK